MAVTFEVAPTSAEVESKVDPVDLANGEPTEANEAPATTAADNSASEVEACLDYFHDALRGDQQPTPTVDPELLRKWEQDCNEATKQHAITIEQTKALMVELDKQISYKTDELKSIKDEKKGAVERLIRLEAKGPEFPPKPQPKPVVVSGSAGEPTEGNTTTAEVKEPNTDDSWRLVPTVKILGIERLGQKKMDSIVDAFPTLGDLEDIRGEASKEFVHFSEKLPDGIGKTIADKIEERMMDEIAKFSVGLKVVSPPADVEESDTADTDDIPPEDINQETGEVITHDVEYEDVDDSEVDSEQDEEVDALADL